jgi:hypothetical protein
MDLVMQGNSLVSIRFSADSIVPIICQIQTIGWPVPPSGNCYYMALGTDNGRQGAGGEGDVPGSSGSKAKAEKVVVVACKLWSGVIP